MSDYEPDFSIPAEDTTPNEEQEINTEEVAEETQSEESAPQEAGEETNTAAEAEQAATPPPFLSIKYNHETIDMNEEEVRNTVQLAKKNEAIYKELDYLAAQNDQSVSDFVKGIAKASEDAYLNKLRDKYGDEDEETINELMELYRNKNKEKYDAVLKMRKEEAETAAAEQEQSIANRVSQQLTELQSVFPDVKEFNDIPEAVRRKALEGSDLLKEYLMYQHNEALKIEKNKKAEQKAQSATSGSVQSPEQTEGSAEKAAFLSGLRGKQ